MGKFGVIQSAVGTQSIEQYVEALLAALPPIYDKDSENTLLRTFYTALAEELVKADIKLESVANDNYLTVQVTDEIKVRGFGPLDRLENENAYDIISIRFRQTNSEVLQNMYLSEGENLIQLFFIPEDGSFNLYESMQRTQPLSNFTFHLQENNKVLINSPRTGSFTLGYLDTGDVIRFSENIIVPVGLFRLGYNEGGYGELGWSE